MKKTSISIALLLSSIIFLFSNLIFWSMKSEYNPKINAWVYHLTDGYKIEKFYNQYSVLLSYEQIHYDLSDKWISAFSCNDRYIKLRLNKDGDHHEYLLIDTLKQQTYGPYKEEKEFEIFVRNQLNTDGVYSYDTIDNWIYTNNMPKGAIRIIEP